jgi:hypothetical protein
MLGVHRQSLNLATSNLLNTGLIRYRWGRLTIHDRRGLEAASCECYPVAPREFERMFG